MVTTCQRLHVVSVQAILCPLARWARLRRHSSRLQSGQQDILAALTQTASRGRCVAAAARAAGGASGDGSDTEGRVLADHPA